MVHADPEYLEGFLEPFLHDLRSPLLAAIGFTEALSPAGEGVEAADEELIDGLRRSLERVEEVIGLARRLLEVRAGLSASEPETVHVTRLLRERVSASEMPARLVSVPGEGVVARLHRSFVDQAVGELLGNVLDHAPPGASARLRLERTEDDAVLIVLDDDGPGVPEALREEIFRPFARGHAPPSRGGYGLGLAVVAEVATAHGGSAWVEESPQGGASFRLLLHPLSELPGGGPGLSPTRGPGAC